MQTLATALVLSIRYIERRDSSFSDDDDVRALEDISAALVGLSQEERQAFTDASVALGMPELLNQLGLEPL